MYNNPYMPYNPVQNIDRQIEELQNMKARYSQQPQVTNVINPTQPQMSTNNMIEWRILNENEQVDNLYVKNKTLFISDKNMILKDVDGKLEKWDIKKTYPVDEKDKKIEELEQQIIELKGMINNEYSESIKPTRSIEQSDANVNVDDESTAKANVSKSKK